jgi:hypothetical protein
MHSTWYSKADLEDEMENKNTERKTYASPKLTEYGDIKNLTLSFGRTGSLDGGTRRDRTQTKA